MLLFLQLIIHTNDEHVRPRIEPSAYTTSYAYVLELFSEAERGALVNLRYG